MTPEAERLKTKMTEWRSWMSDDDPHSITHQISQMLWDDVTFRVVNECRRLAPEAEEGGVQLNRLVHTFIDRCYFNTQALAIRRLVERNFPQPKKAVWSLRRLLDDIEANAALYTRGNIFDAERLLYDYSALQERAKLDEAQKIRAARSEGKRTFACWLDNEWEKPYTLHCDFDRMSGASVASRSRDDVLDVTLLHALRERLHICEGVTAYVKKRVAHAADPENREVVPEGQKSLYLQHIYGCHAAICHVASFVNAYILRKGQLHPLVIPQYDQFGYIHRPWISEANVEKLRAVWKEQDELTHKWSWPEWPEGWHKAKESK